MNGITKRLPWGSDDKSLIDGALYVVEDYIERDCHRCEGCIAKEDSFLCAGLICCSSERHDERNVIFVGIDNE